MPELEQLLGRADALRHAALTIAGVNLARLPIQSSYPHTLESLAEAPEWLVGKLRLSGALPGRAEVLGVAVEPFKRDESLKSSMGRARVRWSDGQGAERELRCLAKFAPTGSSVRDELVYAWQQVNEREVAFYQALAARVPIRVPRCYAACSTKFTGRMCLLMEELEGVEEVDEAVGASAPQVEAAIRVMARLHAAFWGVRIDEIMASWPPTQRPLGPPWSMDHLVWEEAPETFKEIWRQTWRRGRRAPLTLLHGDLRVGNMLFDADGDEDPCFIDWQASRTGHGALDLAFFLTLSVDPQLRRGHQEAWLDLYHRELVARGVRGYTRRDLARDYRLNSLYTLLLLALPRLSREVNVNDENAEMSARIARAWKDRLRAYCDEIDHAWIASSYRLDEGRVREVMTFRDDL